MKFTVKSLTCLDYKSAYDIFSETFVREECLEFSNNWKYRCYEKSLGVFLRDVGLVGFVLVSNYRNYINCIAVHPEFQNYSVGTTLLQHILKGCVQTSSNLYLIPASDRLKDWYGRKGFQITQTFQSVRNQRGTYMNFHSHGTRKQRRFLQAVLQ